MTDHPTNLDTMLSAEQLAALLSSMGFKVTPATLATLRSRGGGPKFAKFGRTPLYRWGDALDWAQSRCSPVVENTSQLPHHKLRKQRAA
jgi:hypothetical protein